MTGTNPSANDESNPWMRGLVVFGLFAIIFGIVLIGGATSSFDENSSWALVGTAMLTAGLTAWIGCAVVGALRWTPATVEDQSPTWTPQFSGWYPSPDGRGERYFDGTTWTNRIR